MQTFRDETLKQLKISKKFVANNEVTREIEYTSSTTMKVIKNTFFNYIEELKGKHFQKLLDSKFEDSKKWLIYLNKLLDSMQLDKFFEDFIKPEVEDFESQPYFVTMKNASNAELLNMIT